MKIVWFSCGVTSAVAAKLSLLKGSSVKIVFIETGSEEKDSIRFLHDCEKWYDHPIEIYSTDKYKNHFDVIAKKRFINSAGGAPCSYHLKKVVRWKIEDEVKEWDAQVFGYDISEKKRATRFLEQNPKTKAEYPLIDAQLTKQDCMAILEKNGIPIPNMYKLGFHNNNCIGCVKGGKGYWTLIKKEYPDVFRKMAEVERSIGHSCIKDCFLDELQPVDMPPIVPSCSLFCEPDFMDI